ncbi:hypothetical protein BC835DRAFT_1341525 [Cytidiella melzeri]|nr:hypothetical protein BC835DRAFT_1341525 [Cytidiella melzeri]
MDPGIQDRQQTEIYALKSIYGNDFVECDPPKVWKGAPRLPEFVIRVRHPDPKHAEDTFFSLHVKLPKTYPKLAAPAFTVQPPTAGLKAAQLNAVLQAIQEHVQTLKDSEMVFEAIDAAQAWLTANVRPSTEPIGSLAVQMARRAYEEEQERKQRQEAEAEHANERERQREQVIEEEIRLNAEKLHQMRKRAMSDVTEVPMDEEDGPRTSSETFAQDIEWQGLRFRKVSLFHPEKELLGTVFQAEPVVDGEGASSLQFELFTVNFESKYYSTAQGRRKLRQLETECLRLTRLRHAHLLSVLAVKLTLSNTSSPSRLSILRERRPSVTLHDILEDCDHVRESRATDYLTQLLSALNAIHTADLIHRGLDTCCVGLVAPSLGQPKCVKVHKVAYYVQLLDMNRSDPFSARSNVPDCPIPDGWMHKDAIDSPLVYTRSRDIHAVGIVLLQMLMGLDVMNRYRDVHEALRNSTISLTMQQQILNMVVSAKKGVSASSLMVSLAGIPLVDTLKTPAIAINGFTPTTPIPGGGVSGSPPIDYMTYRPATRSTSRWKEDWQELEFVGRGGFGRVVKARNKIDKRIYAVKKIMLRSSQSDETIIREVSTLSRLNHRFIVRYYTTWFEYTDTVSTTSSAVGSSIDAYSLESSFDENNPVAINWTKVPPPSNGHSFPNIHFTNSEEVDFEDEPNIHFSNNEEESDFEDEASVHFSGGETPDSEDESDLEGSGTARSSEGDTEDEFPRRGRYVNDILTPVPKLSKTLFIQMEYVERQTLQELVKEGISEEEAWRLFLQIVEALVYMSSLNVIHRDIKGTNIFIDARGDCKIGDFGLATFDLDAIEPLDFEQPYPVDKSHHSLVGGTLFYMAPELRSGEKRPLNRAAAKADMYSLGIVFFEMNYKFTTDFERYKTLQDLRKPEIIFPSDWDARRTRQKQIITWLLQHDPSKRPTAVELSESPLLPPKVEDEHFKNTLGMIVKSDSPYRQSMLTALFEQKPDPGHSFLYDSGDVPEHAVLNGIVHDRMTQIFRLHGAVDMEPPLLLPVLNKEEDSSRAMFLDRNGKAVCLPENLFAPFARLAARIGIRRIKRYHIGDIYKPDPVAGHPKTSKAAIFDIITQDMAYGPSASTAEAISIVNDCLNSFANLDKYEVQLTHTKIHAAVFDHISLSSWSEVQKILLQTNASSSQRRQLLLDRAISRNSADLLETLFEGGADVDVVCARLEKISPSFSSSINEPLREIRSTIQLAMAIGVKRPIIFKPLALLRTKQTFFDGICFEVVKGQSTNQKRWDILATGGRYENYISGFSPVKSRSDGICAVGMQISLEKIAAALAAFQSSSLKDSLKTHRSYGHWSPRRCDVYVAAHPFDLDGTLSERLEVTSFLWRNNISADMMYEFGGAEGENIIEQCSREGILFIVYPRARLHRRDLPAFKVKGILNKTEDSMSRHELVPYLLREIAEQKRIDASISGASWVTESSQSIGPAKESGDSNIQLVTPSDAKKQRKQTKQIFMERAVELRDALKNTMLQSTMPIVAVDVPTLVFEEMSKNTTWINDDNTWKQLQAIFPPQQSVYANQVREAVLRKKNDGCKFLILFLVREERASLLNF